MVIRRVETYEELTRIREWIYITPFYQKLFERAFEDYEKGLFKSDGISWISNLGFVKHPVGILHDWLYWRGKVNRKTADKIFMNVLNTFGFPDYSEFYYKGLRVFGWWYWYKYRIKQAIN